jgi:hypothetical protein
VDELLDLGWEIVDAEAIARRPFHYDAVILRELESPHPLARLLEGMRGETVLIRDPDDSDLVRELAAAGVPAQNLAPAAALA